MIKLMQLVALHISCASAASLATHRGNKIAASQVARHDTAKFLQRSALRTQRLDFAHISSAYTKQSPANSSDHVVEAVNATGSFSAGLHGDLKFEAYGAAVLGMICLVIAMFHQQGFFVCLQVVLYVSCLALIKISLKLVYEYDFSYPKFITACHLLISSLAAFAVLGHRSFVSGQYMPIPTAKEFFMGILPIAGTFGFSIAAENSALVFVSAAFSEVVASSNPVMSAFLTWAFGMHFALPLLMPITVVVFGCAISVTGEISFSVIGLGLLFLSVFLRGLKAVMQQKLMTGDTKEKFDPVTLMAWTCMCAFWVVITFSACTEGIAPMKQIMATPDLFELLVALLGSCVIACTLNISALFVIKHLGAVGMQMVSQMKAILVVIGGITFLSETFTTSQWIGFATVLSGVYWYSHMHRILNPNAKGH